MGSPQSIAMAGDSIQPGTPPILQRNRQRIFAPKSEIFPCLAGLLIPADYGLNLKAHRERVRKIEPTYGLTRFVTRFAFRLVDPSVGLLTAAS
jgi:hypothetical protein